jgi:hypothetical protein
MNSIVEKDFTDKDRSLDFLLIILNPESSNLQMKGYEKNLNVIIDCVLSQIQIKAITISRANN